MEQCRVCKREAVFMAVLHDGAKVPYCALHLPKWDTFEEQIAYDNLLAVAKQCVGQR